jgi:tRNA(Arg) A34 adenosine deaminase TadA
MCLGAIYWARPDRVFFAATAADAAAAGFDDGFIYEELRREPARRKIPMTPIMREEALAAFRAWREQPGRTEY